MITVQSSANENTLGCWESGWLFFFLKKKNPLYLQNFKKIINFSCHLAASPYELQTKQIWGEINNRKTWLN